ncbi:hypothetical protein HYH03_005179 [Edaphochlamys debaryana]|uniref:Peptidase M11 gametolysin domain-containing protein n=1 Tax=Edaphochlamys debaryana TaxID=47281 RepID=A0A835Y692_9CHLO|nr:hypothetical protein HYH03_005179 [Edaphochlamys debaryana]|eukprot:KAG2496771.1 hypothetical protein HYH03_005179 [Edaphochlamys debaryana]
MARKLLWRALGVRVLLTLLLRTSLCQADSVIEGELEVWLPDNDLPPTYYLALDTGGGRELLAPDAATGQRLIANAGRRIRVHYNPRRSQLQLKQQQAPVEVSWFENVEVRYFPPDAPSALSGSSSPGGVKPQDTVNLAGSPPPATAPANEVLIGTAPKVIYSVVFLFKFCGYDYAVNSTQFWKRWTNGPKTQPNDYTFENYVRKCSFGRSQHSNDSTAVFEVPLPCTGSTPFGDFNFTNRCSSPETKGWFYLANDYVRNTLGVNLDKYKQKIGVIPVELGDACGWGGNAQIGCSPTTGCTVMISGAMSRYLTFYIHEMGHNWGLLHATAWYSTSAYADKMCFMGSGAACLNAANGWKMGWALTLPGADLKGATFPIGRWQTFDMPYQDQAYASHVRIDPDWATPNVTTVLNTTTNVTTTVVEPSLPAFYISARIKDLPFEGGYYDDYWDERDMPSATGRVALHSSPANQTLASMSMTHLHALLGPRETFRLPLGIVVRVDGLNASGGANVSLCRSDRQAESRADGSCADGLDNDCDGKADMDDEDCWLSSPPLPPRPPAASPVAQASACAAETVAAPTTPPFSIAGLTSSAPVSETALLPPKAPSCPA